MAVPKKLRFEILKRDSFKCRYCGRTEADGVKLHIDHVIPVSLGGRNDEENLATACADCNLGKSANMLNDPRIIGIDFTEQKKIFDTAHESLERYREYIKAKDIWEYQLVSQLIEPLSGVWPPWWQVMDQDVVWLYTHEPLFPMPKNLPLSEAVVSDLVDNCFRAEAQVKRSVLHFFKHLGPEPVREAAAISSQKASQDGGFLYDDAFKYFCGICHKLIAKRGGYADRDR